MVERRKIILCKSITPPRFQSNPLRASLPSYPPQHIPYVIVIEHSLPKLITHIASVVALSMFILANTAIWTTKQTPLIISTNRKVKPHSWMKTIHSTSSLIQGCLSTYSPRGHQIVMFFRLFIKPASKTRQSLRTRLSFGHLVVSGESTQNKILENFFDHMRQQTDRICTLVPPDNRVRKSKLSC